MHETSNSQRVPLGAAQDNAAGNSVPVTAAACAYDMIYERLQLAQFNSTMQVARALLALEL